MKILVLFGPDQFGGSFVIAERVARHLKQEGYEVLLVLRDPTMLKIYIELGYEVKVIPSMIRQIHPIKDLQTIFTLYKLYKEQKCSMIHSHTSKSGVYARALKLFCPKVKVMHTVHGYYFPKTLIGGSLFLWIERFLYRFCDGITFVNKEDYDRASPWFKHPLSRVIYNGVEIYDDIENYDLYKGPLKVAINARLVWEKGFKDVIELVNRLDATKFEFHIMGEGSDGEAIRSSLQGFSHVKFYGHISYVHEILKMCQINLLPSYREGLSLSILEAMALGIPTLAYDIRGNRELIDDNKHGLLVPTGDVNALYDSLMRYFDNPFLRAKHGISAHEKAKHAFGLDTMLTNYSEVIGIILNEKH